MSLHISITKGKLSAFCRKNKIRKLSVFGSAIRSDFNLQSDIDLLVEFEEGHTPGLLGFSQIQRELSQLLGGRDVDLHTPRELSRYFRDQVLESAEVQYAAG